MNFKARGDTAEMFDPVEESFDAVALLIKRFGKAMLFVAVGLVGYVRCRALCLDPLAQPIGIIGFVAEKDITYRPRSVSKMSAPRRSWAWPGVRRNLIGRPRASVSAWILVVNPPLEAAHTMNCVNFFYVGGMLMNAHDRRVDHLDIAVVGLGDGVHEPIPMTGLAPAVEAIVAGRVGGP